MKYSKDTFKALIEETKQSGWTKDIWTKLLDHLAEQNPEVSPSERRKEGRRLKNLILRSDVELLPAEEQEDKKRYSEEEFDKKLRGFFIYKNSPLKVEHLKQEGFKESLVTTKNAALTKDLSNFFRAIKDVFSDDNTVLDNLSTLIKIHQRDIKLYSTATKDSKTYVDIGWADEIGDMQLSRWSTRDKIYDYWADKYSKFEAMEESVKKFLEDVDKLKESQFGKEKETKGAFKEFYADVDRVRKMVDDGKVKNYVLHLNEFSAKTPDTFTKALKILHAFSKLQGVVQEKEQKEKEKETFESGRDYGKDEVTGKVTESEWIDDSDQNLVEEILTEVKEPKGGITDVLLDPIMWYENHKDFDSIKISKRELEQIEQYILGGRNRAGLKHYLFEEYPQYEESFEKWYDAFKKQITIIERNKNAFYLPVSSFILEYAKGNEKFSIDNLTHENVHHLQDNTADFLEAIVDIDKSIIESFTIYQKNMTGKNPDKIITESFSERGRPSSREQGARYIPKQVDKSWNSMLEQLNEYYLIPSSSKYIVQQSERPKWTKGKGLMLALKNAHMNPIGSFLRKTLDYSLEGITSRQINSLTEFIDTVRKGGIKDFRQKHVYRLGKRATNTLNKLFGKEYASKNKESIGSIIFDLAKTTGYVQKLKGDNKDIPQFMNDDLEMLDLQYRRQQKKQKTYPIDMLKFAFETPEVIAWLGESESRDIYESNLGTQSMLDAPVADAFKKLKTTLDSFHKMDSINTSLLNAHDTIRKMENKPIVYASLSLTDVQHMDDVLTKMEVDYNMDLTATEIDRIVKAVSSYSSIASNYGIHEESVYTIKAMFR